MEQSVSKHMMGIKMMRLAPPTVEKNIADLKSSFLLLPQTFGNIYLSERLTCCLSIPNCMPHPVQLTSVRCEVHTPSLNTMVVDKAENVTLNENDSFSELIHYNIRDLGQHLLKCEVGYLTPSGLACCVKKFFKFHVNKPMHIETKCHKTQAPDEVLLEIMIENITPGTIYLDRVQLVPSNLDIKILEMNDGAIQSQLLTTNVTQFLFLIKFVEKFSSKAPEIGKVDILWRSSSFSRQSKIQTSRLVADCLDTCDVSLTVIDACSSCRIAEPFDFECEIQNKSQHSMDLTLKFNMKEMNKCYAGSSEQVLGPLRSDESKKFKLTIYPSTRGIIDVGGLEIIDSYTKDVHTFHNVLQVLVE